MESNDRPYIAVTQIFRYVQILMTVNISQKKKRIP